MSCTTAKSRCQSESKKSNHRIGPRRSVHRKSLTVRKSCTRNQDTQCEKALNMNISFENKVALVTGAGSGLGLATAKAFAESGGSVVLADWAETEVRAAAKELADKGHKTLAVTCDVSDDEQDEAMVKKIVAQMRRL